MCDDFPLGCKTTYRAFSQDEVIEIVDDSKAQLGLRPVTVKVKTHPEKTDTHSAGVLFKMC